MRYGYCRVSTKKQQKEGNSLEMQELTLRNAGAEIIFKEAFTGTKASRPEFDRLMRRLKAGDTLLVTKLDRIARSAAHGAKIVEELLQRDVVVDILNMGRMDNSPSGKLIRNIMFAFAEFERDMIVERTQEGKVIARQKEGYKEGRPAIYSSEKREEVLRLLSVYTYKEVSKKTGISVSTLVRIKRRSRK